MCGTRGSTGKSMNTKSFSLSLSFFFCLAIVHSRKFITNMVAVKVGQHACFV